MEKYSDLPVKIAKEAVECYMCHGRLSSLPVELPNELEKKAAVFVCLKKYGQLRGCIGTLEPTYENLAKEIQINAVSAATQDPRFPAVSIDELQDLEYSIDVLSLPKEVRDTSILNPKRFGVIVDFQGKRGVLLPDLEGVDTVEKQLSIAASKAGICSHANFKIMAFEVTRYPLNEKK